MRIDQITQRLDASWEYSTSGNEPIVPHLIGPGGIGKSTAVKEWSKKKAAELHLQWVDYEKIPVQEVDKILNTRSEYFVYADLRITGLDPIDVNGIPRTIDNKYVHFLPLDLAQILSNGYGALVLDEYNDESRPNMQAAVKKIVRDHKIGSITISPKVMVVAISNPMDSSTIANPMSKPVRDRFDFIQTDAPSVKAWGEYMYANYGNNWNKKTLAYLSWKPSDLLANSNESEDNGWTPPATPRGWTYVALMTHLNPQYLESVAEGKLGPVGASFAAFTRVNVPTFNSLVQNPAQLSSFKVQEKVLAAMTIAENASNTNQVIKIFEYAAEKDDREFLVYTLTQLKKNDFEAVFKKAVANPNLLKILQEIGRDI